MADPSAMVRMAYVDVTNTGRTMDFNFPEGHAHFERVPEGVMMIVNGKPYGLSKEALPVIGRFFLAAAVMLGVDLNEGWDKPIQEGGRRIA